MEIQAVPTLIKPNIDEIRMLTGKSCDDIHDIIEAAKEIHRNGVEIVAVSLGAEGSLAVSHEGIFRAEVPKIHAVNTVGCGDSMIAGFAVGIGGTAPFRNSQKGKRHFCSGSYEGRNRIFLYGGYGKAPSSD